MQALPPPGRPHRHAGRHRASAIIARERLQGPSRGALDTDPTASGLHQGSQSAGRLRTEEGAEQRATKATLSQYPVSRRLVRSVEGVSSMRAGLVGGRRLGGESRALEMKTPPAFRRVSVFRHRPWNGGLGHRRD